MADAALSPKIEPDKAEMRCKWCSGLVKRRHPKARYCSEKCKQRYRNFNRSIEDGYWPKEMQGPRPPTRCPECSVIFERTDPKKVYCTERCSCRAWRKTDVGREYFARNEVQERLRLSARRYSNSEKGKLAQRERDSRPHNVKRREEWSKSDHGRKVKAECQRRRASERALSLLLLPTQQTPEL